MGNDQLVTQEIIWYKDIKLLIGVILVIFSFVLGFYGKVLFVIRFYEPIYLISGLSIYAFSFILLFLGVFLVGWETMKMIQQRIHHHVRNTVKQTYNHAKELPKRSLKYTKELHKKGLQYTEKISKKIKQKIKQND
jgi:uncharacterized membrane protein